MIINQRAPGKWLKAGPTVCYKGKPTFISHGDYKTMQECGIDFSKPHKIIYVFTDDSRDETIMSQESLKHYKPGYYHIYTREAYAILKRQMLWLASEAEADYNWYVKRRSCTATKMWKSKKQFQSECTRLEQEQNRYQMCYDYLKAQYESKGPGAAIPCQAGAGIRDYEISFGAIVKLTRRPRKGQRLVKNRLQDEKRQNDWLYSMF